MEIRRLLALAGAFLMVMSLVTAPAAGQERDPAQTERIPLTGPVAGAIELSQLRFPDTAEHVVLATTASFADSLSAAPLTADGPLLLNSPTQLEASVASEIDRVLPGGGTVLLLGGVAALDQQVATDLEARGHEVRRLAGDTRITTGIAVAREVAARYGTGETVLVARAFGEGTAAWADSVTGGAWAADQRVPLLLTPTEAADDDVSALLAELGTTESIVLGGTAAISESAAAQLPGARRIAGGERSATAAAIAEQLWGPTAGYLVINGYVNSGWTAGLPAAGLAADRDEPLLVADVDHVPGPTLQRLGLGCETGPARIHTTLVGGTDVLGEGVSTAIDQQDGGECPASASVIIDGTGLGVTSLGAPGEEAVAAVTEALGPPSYVSEEFFPFCETFGGGRGRVYEWGGVLSLYIIDPEEDIHGNPGTGQTEFWGGIYGGFTYDPATDELIRRPDTLGLQTDRGIGVGATGAQVQEAYGAEAEFIEGFPEGYPPPSWRLPDDLYAYTDTNDPQTSRIDTFLIGNGCGD